MAGNILQNSLSGKNMMQKTRGFFLQNQEFIFDQMDISVVASSPEQKEPSGFLAIACNADTGMTRVFCARPLPETNEANCNTGYSEC